MMWQLARLQENDDSEEDQNSVKNDPQRANVEQPVMLTDEQQESAEIQHQEYQTN